MGSRVGSVTGLPVVTDCYSNHISVSPVSLFLCASASLSLSRSLVQDPRGPASFRKRKHNNTTTVLEPTNSSRFSNLVAQRHSLTPSNPFTPIQFIPSNTNQSLTNTSQLTLSHPHIAFTLEASPNTNISSSPLDTYPTNEEFDDHPQPIKQKFRNIYKIMEATRPFEALMADLGPEPIDEFEDDNGDIPLEDINLTPKAALNGPESEMWKSAMQTEMDALMRNRTCTLVPRPKNGNVISSKWVLTTKKDAHGVVTRYKARVVARGFYQILVVDFKETFVPTLKMVPLRTTLAFSAGFNFELHHLDIKTAFLRGELNEEIFMQQPPFLKIQNSQSMIVSFISQCMV